MVLCVGLSKQCWQDGSDGNFDSHKIFSILNLLHCIYSLILIISKHAPEVFDRRAAF